MMSMNQPGQLSSNEIYEEIKIACFNILGETKIIWLSVCFERRQNPSIHYSYISNWDEEAQ